MSNFPEVIRHYLPFEAVDADSKIYNVTAVYDGWTRWETDTDIDEIEQYKIKPRLVKIESLTDEQFLVCAQILGSNEHVTDESKIAQAKELLTTNKLFNGQTNIPGIRWITLGVYLFEQKVDLFKLIENELAVES